MTFGTEVTDKKSWGVNVGSKASLELPAGIVRSELTLSLEKELASELKTLSRTADTTSKNALLTPALSDAPFVCTPF